VDLANQYHVTAIFSEPEYSPKLAQALAGSAHISIVDNLYDDSIGTNPKVHDYISMLQYDTGEIVKASSERRSLARAVLRRRSGQH